MNEELKIIIKAVTDEANKNLEGVKKKLNEVKNSGTEAGKNVDISMKAIGKGAATAIAAVAALTTAMVALGKSSMEFRKEQAKLNAAFEAMGSSAGQAAQTYQELYRFLGDTGQATEAAQSLSKITTSQEELAEWTKILQGVYASFGSSLPVESLAEAANETIKVGQVTGAMADALNWLGVSEDAVNEKLKTTTSLEEREVLLRGILNNLYLNAANSYEQSNKALLKYNESQISLDQALANATAYVIPLMTTLNQLAATLLNVLRPAFENISAVIIAFVQWVMAGIKAVGMFFGIFGKSEASASSISDSMGAISVNTSKVSTGINKLGDSFADATKEAEKLKKQTMGFDELNVVSSQKTSTAGAAGGGAADVGAIEIPEISIPEISLDSVKLPGLEDFEDKVAKIKEYLDPIAVLVATIGTAIGLWKLTNFLTDIAGVLKGVSTLKGLTKEVIEEAMDAGKLTQLEAESYKRMESIKQQAKMFAGELLVAGGALATFYGYSDAWVNGIDWGSLAITLAGLAATITGIGLMFGTMAASIATVAAGVALLVLGVVDFINYGPTIENVILILGGAIAIAVGLATAGVSVVVAAVIGLVAAIGGFVAAILLEKPAIMSVEEAQENLTAAKERAAEAENGYINAVDAAEAAMKRLEEAEKAAGITGEDLYKQVQDGTLNYADMTDAQKEVYKAYLDNEKKQKDLVKATEEFEAAKKAEIIASHEHELALAKESGSYDEFKKSVIKAFEEGSLSAEEARDLLSKSMSEMSDDAQQTFMEDIPDSLKDGLDPHKYESTGTKISKWFSNLWEDIKYIFSVVGNWFKDVFTSAWNGIKNAWSGVKNWFIGVWDGIKSVFSSVGTWFKDTFTKAWTSVKNVFSKGGKVFTGIKDGIVSSFKTVVNALITGINKVVKLPFEGLNGVLNTIHGLSIAGIKPFSWLNWRAPIPQLPKLAKGGIIDSATIAMIGEQGKEAVVPLENNTEWMDKLAERIAARNQAPSKIVLKVGEKELGWATIGSINGITKQTGTLPLVLA